MTRPAEGMVRVACDFESGPFAWWHPTDREPCDNPLGSTIADVPAELWAQYEVARDALGVAEDALDAALTAAARKVAT